MRPTLLFLLACTCITKTIAQDFYLKAGTGYAFAMPGQKKDQLGNALNGTVNHSTGTGIPTTYDLKNASFSSGLHAQVGGGYMFTKNVGIEVTIDMGVTSRTYTETEINLANTSSQNYDYISDRKAKTSLLFTPSLVMQTANKYWNVYMRMGVALPIISGMKQDEVVHLYTGTINRYSWDIQNYFSPGFSAATGLKRNIGNGLSIWGEVSMLYMALNREERDLQSANINGTNYLPSQLTGSAQHYSKDGSSGYASFSQPYSNLSVIVGISHTIKKAATPKSHS